MLYIFVIADVDYFTYLVYYIRKTPLNTSVSVTYTVLMLNFMVC